mmetsp:Transcript_88941/g.108795  ORF Transcript_88941/g.108795 Transcript_88941/m.108795 type:complete len:263 (-) Transcript_88941:13-801(-)
MRVDAAEFVPSTWVTAHAAQSRPPVSLSAASPVFVPGGKGAWNGQAQEWPGQWEQTAWQPASETPMPYAADFSGPMSYVDEESFLTPQLLSDEPAVAASGSTSPKSNGEEDAPAEADDPWPSSHSQASAGSAGLGAESRPKVGFLRVQGRRLQWHLERGRDLGLEWSRGRGVDSPKFSVAGVTLRLAFFPTGTSLTSDGQCAVAVLCEEKAKLKFELFLNGRRSGSKVMLGQSFSCDFRADPVESIEVSLEVQSNLSYTTFY